MDKTQRGYQAQLLLDNELFRETLANADAEFHRAWRNAKTVEAREDCFRYVKVIERITADLQQVAITGKIEQKRMNELSADRGTLLWPKKLA